MIRNHSSAGMPNHGSHSWIRLRPHLTTVGAFLLVICALLIPSPAAAQTVSVSSVSGPAGSSVDLTVNFAPGIPSVSTLQFDLGFPSSLGFDSVLTGTAATNAGKSASGSIIAGGARILVFGLNQNAIGSGAIAVARLNIAPGTSPSAFTVTIGNILASDPDGGNITAFGSNGSVTVTAPSDITPPVISLVNGSGITQSSAVIGWTTNEASNSQVDYGLTTSYGTSTAINSSMVVAHSQAISGLAASTLYHYRVKSRDAAGNLATSTDFTFTTSTAPDVTAPVISGINSSSITQSGAVIGWTTNEASNSQVEYGLTTSYGSSTTINASMVVSHSQALSGLAASTLYHYRVKSRDAAGNLATSTDFTFTTSTAPDITAPVISGVNSSGISQSTAVIGWTTNEASNSQVEYGLTTSYGSSTTINASMVVSHSQALSGLNRLYAVPLSGEIPGCGRQPGDVHRLHVHDLDGPRHHGTGYQRRQQLRHQSIHRSDWLDHQ